MKTTVFWDVALCSLMMEAVSTSETLVSFYQTKPRNIQEDSHLQKESVCVMATFHMNTRAEPTVEAQ
jgi:hypothetical protein